MSKIRTTALGLAATALLIAPAAADAKKSKRSARADSHAALKVNLQILQAPCGLLGTKGTVLLGQPVDLCI